MQKDDMRTGDGGVFAAMPRVLGGSAGNGR